MTTLQYLNNLANCINVIGWASVISLGLLIARDFHRDIKDSSMRARLS